ncbi:unnamed protein product [Amaranthus hypochondriacus]
MSSPPIITSSSSSNPFSSLPEDVIRAHIFPRLDGCSLASVGCVTPELHSLSSDHQLWSHICHSTWPSTTTSTLTPLISSFKGGARSFFALSTLPPNHNLPSPSPSPSLSALPDQVISAVDIFYRGKCIYSKAQATETVSGWFKCSPFRIDLVGPKEAVPTPISRPSHEDTCQSLYADLELSWIVVDPTGHKAVNVSSLLPVSVERHWLSGEVHIRYATVVGGHVTCSVEVTCVGGGPGGLVLHVTEACLKMEDIDGAHLNGRDSLVVLQRVLEGKRGNLCSENGKMRKVEEKRKKYLEFLERRKERREKILRREGRLDNLCVGIGSFLFVGLFYLLCFY